MNTSKYQLIWKLMAGERLRYGAAIGSLVLASWFLYLVPVASSVVFDGVIEAEPTKASRFVVQIVEWAGGREYLRFHLWLTVFVMRSNSGEKTIIGSWPRPSNEGACLFVAESRERSTAVAARVYRTRTEQRR